MRNFTRLGFCLAAAMIVWGCGGDRDAVRTPLGQSDPRSMGGGAAPSPSPMGGEAKVALDSANLLFRAKAYDRALAQYRRSSRLAPGELAPLLGVLMIADVTKNKALADSTMPRIRELNPAAVDTAMSHAELLRVHPRTTKPQP